MHLPRHAGAGCICRHLKTDASRCELPPMRHSPAALPTHEWAHCKSSTIAMHICSIYPLAVFSNGGLSVLHCIVHNTVPLETPSKTLATPLHPLLLPAPRLLQLLHFNGAANTGYCIHVVHVQHRCPVQQRSRRAWPAAAQHYCGSRDSRGGAAT